ncbi:MAG: amino acid ABC transporter permease [Anderseniella sp.]
MALLKPIPGISTASATDMAVLKPVTVATPGSASDINFSRFVSDLPWWTLPVLAAIIMMWPMTAYAQSTYTMADATAALVKWLPFLVFQGFVFNILISITTMALGTVAGVVLGLMQISPNRTISRSAWLITQTFRNSPWLVLLFIVMLAFPFKIEIGGLIIQIPDWIKAVFGLSLPIMANISEVVRGGISSVPSGQWEAAESLAYSRQQTLWRIILPQCFKRMIPPWMNWYAILTMATPLVSLLGVEEIVTLSRQAMAAENGRPELLVPFYGFCLVIFFAYCYPIARLTIALERKYTVKL